MTKSHLEARNDIAAESKAAFLTIGRRRARGRLPAEIFEEALTNSSHCPRHGGEFADVALRLGRCCWPRRAGGVQRGRLHGRARAVAEGGRGALPRLRRRPRRPRRRARQPINGPGMCGADFPFRVSSLGERWRWVSATICARRARSRMRPALSPPRWPIAEPPDSAGGYEPRGAQRPQVDTRPLPPPPRGPASVYRSDDDRCRSIRRRRRRAAERLRLPPAVRLGADAASRAHPRAELDRVAGLRSLARAL